MITRLRNGTRKKFVVTTFPPSPTTFLLYTFSFFFFFIPRPLQRLGASTLGPSSRFTTSLVQSRKKGYIENCHREIKGISSNNRIFLPVTVLLDLVFMLSFFLCLSLSLFIFLSVRIGRWKVTNQFTSMLVRCFWY